MKSILPPQPPGRCTFCGAYLKGFGGELPSGSYCGNSPCYRVGLLVEKATRLESDHQKLKEEMAKMSALADALVAKTESLIKTVAILEGISPG